MKNVGPKGGDRASQRSRLGHERGRGRGVVGKREVARAGRCDPVLPGTVPRGDRRLVPRCDQAGGQLQCDALGAPSVDVRDDLEYPHPATFRLRGEVRVP